MSVSAFPIACSREMLKVLDAQIARAVGRSAETVRSYRLGRITPPAEVVRAMAAFRYQRAQRLIAEVRAELQRLESEARVAGLALAPRGGGDVAPVSMGSGPREGMRDARRCTDTARDDAEAS